MDKGIILAGILMVTILALSFYVWNIGRNATGAAGAVVGQDWNGNIKEFKIEAKQWVFSPDEIKVQKGDKVKIILMSRDVPHGFNLPEFGVNKYIEPGKETSAEFIADKTGTFTFSCSVFCGGGHLAMNGKLIVN